MEFPIYRPRRLRTSETLRSMVRETSLAPTDLIYPLFVKPGEGARDPQTHRPTDLQTHRPTDKGIFPMDPIFWSILLLAFGLALIVSEKSAPVDDQ